MITERAVNVDLLTGKIYELDDILTFDGEFAKLWCDAAFPKIKTVLFLLLTAEC